MEDVCRVCARSNISLMDIFSKFGNDGLRPADMLIETVDCNLHPNDAFPKKICLTCVVATQKTFKLKRTYEQSHQHFSRLLNLNNGCEEPECVEQTNTQTEFQDNLEAKENERDNTEEVITKCLKFEVEETEMEDCQMNEVSIKNEQEEEEEEQEESQLQEMEMGDEFIKNETTFMESNSINSYLIDNNKLSTHFCDHCGEGFPSNTKLILHSLDHYNLDQNNQCPYCPKSYKFRKGLNYHVVVHSGEQPYKCPHCPRTFFYKTTIDRHVLIHLNFRPFKCSHCDQSFTYFAQLKYHQLAEHLGKRSKCNYCPLSFRTYDKLKKHMRVHSSDRPLQCPHCPNRFFKQGHLKNHMATHLIERPFKCEDCLKAFATRSDFNQHNNFQCQVPKNIKREKSHSIRTRFDTRVKTEKHET